MTILVNGELILYGFVGDNYWGEGFTDREVIDALVEHGRDEPITVRLNSGGGYVDAGIAIFNALKSHAGKVTVIVDAMAASSASVIAMAGDERLMRTGAMMMIHDPSGGVWGTASDMEAFAKVMEKHAENLASIYAEVTGGDKDDIRESMKSELWMNADEAVEQGFATALEKQKVKQTAAHDYSIYANAPKRLVALAKSKDWTRAKAKISAAASAPAQPSIDKENLQMPPLSQAEQTAADTNKLVADAVAKALADSKARLKAITACEDAKGREALAEHLAHETDMSAEHAIAVLKAAPLAADTTVTPPQGSTQYEQQRVQAANLASPAAPSSQASKPNINANAIYASRRQHQGK